MIYLDKTQPVPLYKQLYSEIRRELDEGIYQKRPLAPIRILSRELGISRNTVSQAYQQLLAEGYIRSVPGSGYYQNDLGPLPVSRPEKTFSDAISPTKQKRAKYVFQYGSAETAAFPWKTWKKCVCAALYEEEDEPLLEYQDSQGYLPLRIALADYLLASRGVHCIPEQIFICGGTQDAVSMLAVLLPPEQFRAGIEDPGYDGVRNSLLRCGYDPFPILVGSDGIAADVLEKSSCNLVYVTPSHQFPTGAILPAAGRNRLISIMSGRHGYIIEDDYDSEFQYGLSSPIPSLQSLDQNGCVIYLGGLSKTFSPSLRLSYMVLPQTLLPLYHKKFSNYKNPVSDLIQRAFCAMLQSGDYLRHLRRISRRNERKYRLICNLLKDQDHIRPLLTGSGVYLLIRLKSRLTQSETIRYLQNHDIEIFPTSHYWCDPAQADPGLFLLGFASISPDDLEAGITQMIQVINDSGLFEPV